MRILLRRRFPGLGDWEFMLPLAGQSAALAPRLPADEMTRKLAADALEIIGSRTHA